MIKNYFYLSILISLINIILLLNYSYVFVIDSNYLSGMAQDTDLNLRNLNDGGELASKEYEFINLQSASYLVNENFLNVTLWTKSLNKLTIGNLSTENVTYSILINSDPSSNTGKDGVDYQFEINLNNKNKQIIKEQGKDEVITIFTNSKNISDNFVHFYI